MISTYGPKKLLLGLGNTYQIILLPSEEAYDVHNSAIMWEPSISTRGMAALNFVDGYGLPCTWLRIEDEVYILGTAVGEQYSI